MIKSTDRYDYRLPDPPRIFVPSPSTANQTSENGPEELELKWRYEHRYLAQQVLPSLYLGPFSAAKNKAFLIQEGITMLLAIRHSKPATSAIRPVAINAAEEVGIKTMIFDVLDNQSLMRCFPIAIKAIHEHLDQQNATPGHTGKVFVSCLSGNEKAAALVVAYIMESLQMSLIPAIQEVQRARFAAVFDDAMKQFLQTYEDILIAGRQVGDAYDMNNRVTTSALRPAENPNIMVRRNSKRTLFEADEDVMDDVEHDHGKARAFCPFEG